MGNLVQVEAEAGGTRSAQVAADEDAAFVVQAGEAAFGGAATHRVHTHAERLVLAGIAQQALQRGDTAEALVHTQAAKAEGSGLWSELDELQRQLEARTRMARLVRDVEDELAKGGGK